jgi:arsenite/tail-anchored protein-transporting ATPase
MRTILLTGNGGAGVSTLATATALALAAQGRPTLLLSIGPQHSIATLLQTAVSGEAKPIVPNLDAVALDVERELQAAVATFGRALAIGGLQLSPDELPFLPGGDLFFALLRLRVLAPRYERVVIDGGGASSLLRALSLPDSLRWALRTAVGLDRGAGQDARSLVRGALPAAFIPPAQFDAVQDARVEVETLRDQLTPASGASVRWVLRPDETALAEARIAIPALQLHGLLIEALYTRDDANEAAVAEAHNLWSPRPLLQAPLSNATRDVATLATFGAQVYGEHAPDAWLYDSVPVADSFEGQPALVLALPGLPREALGLTLSGDELIVRVGPYRRHVLLPTKLRGISAIRATRDGERLIVRARAQA